MAKQKDGRYRAKITVGHDIAGKAVVKYASGRTRKELEEEKRRLVREFKSGYTDSSDIMFGAYLQQWYELYKKPAVRYSTRQSYATTINKHILPVLGDKALRAVTVMDLQQLLNSKADTCAAIIGNIFSTLEAVFNLAYSQGMIDRNPVVGLVKPSKAKESRRALTDAETAAVLAVADEDPNGLLLKLLYYTGMRLGEACGLQWQDVDFKKQIIHVVRKVDFKAGELGDPKTDNSVRDIPMPEDLRDALLPLRGFGTAFVFPAPDGSFWRNTQLNRLWKSLMQKVYDADNTIEAKEGISILTAHYFRHNYASVLYNAGIDVLSAQKFLGHASAKTTLEIYSHLAKEKEDANAAATRDAFKKGCQKVAREK